MRLDPSEFTPHTETLIAVVLGAVLATLSGLIATQVEARVRRGERQRDSALFLGELIYSLGVIIDETVERKKTGEPYGPITLRMMRAARREMDLYERRREQLYDLRDPALRGRIHGLFVRLTLAVDGVIDVTESLAQNPDQPGFAQAREGAFDFMLTLRRDFPGVVDRLSKIAGEPIDRTISTRPS